MEDVYTIKVKTKPDKRNVYPSERRYSASTVSGLSWVHIALAGTSFLLACLALVNPSSDTLRLSSNDAELKHVNRSEFINDITDTSDIYNENITETIINEYESDINYILVLAPSLVTVFALGAGIASILASVRWYIDHNITWLFIMSVISTVISFIAFIMIIVWLTTNPEGVYLKDFYKDKVPFKDFLVIKNTDIIERNSSHIIISTKSPKYQDESHMFTKKVLSINILIAAFLELLWSVLSVKISYKGMKNNYKEDSNERRGNCVTVVTKIKGNNTKNLSRNSKILPPKPDLIEHYPNNKIKRIFLSQNDDDYYTKTQYDKNKQNTETSSEFYKERMMNFLNRCASLEGISNPEMRTPSVQSETALNTIPESTYVEINLAEPNDTEPKERMTPISWGDTPDHTIYYPNTLNLDHIFSYGAKNQQDGGEEKNNEMKEEVKSVTNK